ncbi:MAG TPA: ABC transporter ATP-binding protein/permease [Xanthobacteraceae bacterium]|nr:ABC transporter ATP-binding protein/permease [Xanthobacteraceae bacterium]
MRSILAFLAEVRRLAVPYFKGEDRWPGRALLAAVILLELATVFLNVQFNEWNARFYNAVQEKNWDVFKSELLFFCVLAAFFIFVGVYQQYLQQWLRIRWRNWLTEKYLARWLDRGTHYRMRTVGDPADNPDQRIAEDLELFTLRSIELSIGLLNAVVTLVSFIVILWQLSNAAGVPLFGTDVKIPGYLVWVALLYAVIGTWITHLIGNVLAALNFNQQRFEADFRYHLVRIRENGEQIALLTGEDVERTGLGVRFARLVANFRAIMNAQKRLTWFTSGYTQASIVFPYVVVSPAYFAGTIPLGILFQTASAFNQVQNAFSFFLRAYATLAEYRAVIQRLTGFEYAIVSANELQAESALQLNERPDQSLTLDDVLLWLPHNKQPVVAAAHVSIPAGDSTLLMGPTGSGKSTLFRAIAGIWPFGTGAIGIPHNARLFVLPQRPYLPFGRLDEALAYPQPAHDFSPDELRSALDAVGLPQLEPRLEDQASWPHVLSQGEQQRLSLARALLAKPDVLLLDEATSAIDEEGEAALYRLIAERLPNTTLISIGHRSTLAAFHKEKLALVAEADGVRHLEAAPA